MSPPIPESPAVKTANKKAKKEKKEKRKREELNQEVHESEVGKLEEHLTGNSEHSIAKKAKKEKKQKKEKSETAKVGGATSGAWTFQDGEILDASIIKKFLDENSIKMTNLRGDAMDIQPILSFEQARFPQQLYKDLSVFSKPTPIQSVAWPPLLQGRDMVGVSKTGSGKTIAFGIPGYTSSLL